ncbi:MAG TPA: hypothetical protein VFQ38_12710 [Longimicrobiales bacterium]|nr:hypothetical protein [Longimicrobiales bacterium]
MDLFLLLVFFHVLGAVGMFAAWGIEAVALGQLRRVATADQARAWMGLRRNAAPLGAGGMLSALVTGLWMMGVRWGPRPWMMAALAGLVIIVVIGVAFDRRATPRLLAALAGRPERLPAIVHAAHATLAASLRLRVALGVAILGLMTLKPGVPGSLAVLAAGLMLGLGAAVGAGRRWTPATT